MEGLAGLRDYLEKGAAKVPAGVDAEQLEQGIAVEMEHTSDPGEARKIALDHLAEDPKYYTALKEMEARREREMETEKSLPGLEAVEDYLRKAEGPRSADEIRKSVLMTSCTPRTNNSVVEWAGQFYNAGGLHVEALKLVKEALQIDRDRTDWQNRRDRRDWLQLQELPKSERDAYEKRRREADRRFDERERKVAESMAKLEAQLVDVRIAEAEKQREVQRIEHSAKSQDADALSKAGGPFIGPKGGRWADARHTVPWKEGGADKVKAKGKDDNDGKTTRTIAGIDVSLTPGVRYLASRPMAEKGRKVYPITIEDSSGRIAHKIDGLGYDAANKFLTAFNNGPMSFDGRMWKAEDEPKDGMSKGSEGEGTRGGHVIGHTASGKPIYASASDGQHHKHLTAAEHGEAEALHRKKAGEVYKAAADRIPSHQDRAVTHKDIVEELTPEEKKTIAHHNEQEAQHLSHKSMHDSPGWRQKRGEPAQKSLDSDSAVLRHLGVSEPMSKAVPVESRNTLLGARDRQAAQVRGHLAAREASLVIEPPAGRADDNAASLLVKALNLPAGQGSPKVPLINQHTLCKSCGTQRSAVLSTCPCCGSGGVISEADAHRSMLMPARRPEDELIGG